MKISNRQQAVLDSWENNDENILVQAVAGSGKSTLLKLIAEKCKSKMLYLAFNSSIKQEMDIKFKDLPYAKASTIHSLGYTSLRAFYKKVVVNNSKYHEILKKLLNTAKNKKLLKKYTWKEKSKIYYTLLDFNEVSRLFLTDDYKQIIKNCRKIDKNFFYFDELNIVWSDLLVLRAKSYEGSSIAIDFTDMVYLPVYKDITIALQPTYLAVDKQNCPL